jgi:NADPH:quinone reductase-like Zn-dependent oxidoreductase
MQMMVLREFGEPGVLELQQAPDPVAGPGQVVIGVEVADVLWVETLVRSGRGQAYFDVRPPYVPGNGVAGRVLSVGPESTRVGSAGQLSHTPVAAADTPAQAAAAHAAIERRSVFGKTLLIV